MPLLNLVNATLTTDRTVTFPDASGTVALTGTPGTVWSLLGNAGTNSLVNYIGTSDFVDFVIKVNGGTAIKALAAGGVEISEGPLKLINQLGTAAELRFYEPSGSGFQYTSFKAQAQAANVNYVLPAAQGAASSVLSNDGSGNLSWAGISSTAWSLLGNAGTNAAVNFVGTTDAVDLALRANNTIRMKVLSAGGVEVSGGPLNLTNTGTAAEIRFYEPSGGGTDYTSFKAQAQAASINYVLPAAQGAASSVLSNDGSGNLSWAAGAAAPEPFLYFNMGIK